MAAWLNGIHSAVHPACCGQAKAAPRCETTYDHEVPKPGYIYALPGIAASVLCRDDWETRVKQAGSARLQGDAGPDGDAGESSKRCCRLPERAWLEGRAGTSGPTSVPFFGLAWGQQLLASWPRRWDTRTCSDQAAFWDDVQQAVALLAGPSFYADGRTEPERTAARIYSGFGGGLRSAAGWKLRSKSGPAVPI